MYRIHNPRRLVAIKPTQKLGLKGIVLPNFLLSLSLSSFSISFAIRFFTQLIQFLDFSHVRYRTQNNCLFFFDQLNIGGWVWKSELIIRNNCRIKRDREIQSCMSWSGKLGFLLNCSNPSSNSNHFITCLLIFTLHYSPQLPPSLFKFEKKRLDPLSFTSNITTTSNSFFGLSINDLSNCRSVDSRLSLRNGVHTHQQ